MKKQLVKSFLLLLGATSILLSSCKKDRGEENDEEVVTTVQLTFVPVGGGNTLTFKYDDPDGPGGANPTTDQVTLAANKTYNVTIQLLNKTTNPVTDVTAEVASEGQAHRFYFLPAAGSNIAVSNLNNDQNGIPLGITSTWTTTGAAHGTVKVVLRHYPGNPPNKAADDPVTSSKSSSDVDVTFHTIVQ